MEIVECAVNWCAHASYRKWWPFSFFSRKIFFFFFPKCFVVIPCDIELDRPAQTSETRTESGHAHTSTKRGSSFVLQPLNGVKPVRIGHSLSPSLSHKHRHTHTRYPPKYVHEEHITVSFTTVYPVWEYIRTISAYPQQQARHYFQCKKKVTNANAVIQIEANSLNHQ